MKPEEKKYILENINKKSVKKLAEELQIKERKVRKFIEETGVRREKTVVPSGGRGENRMKKLSLLLALIIIIGSICYVNALDGKFILDDTVLVKDNLYIKSWSHLTHIFTKSIGAGAAHESNFYRPFQMISYMIDYSLWKSNVHGYHLTNILLHMLVAISIFWFITMLFHDTTLSFFTSALFVAHPLHTEAVTYISGRADPLGMFFMMISFIFYVQQQERRNIGAYLVMVISYLLALLSRESCLILPLLILLYHSAFKKRLNVTPIVSIFAIACAYIMLRITALKFLLPHSTETTTLLERLPGFFVAIAQYLRLIILPFGLHMEYGSTFFRFTDIRAIIGIVIICLSLWYAFKKKDQNNLVFFAISWFFLALLPFSNLFPLNAYMAEHWLYVPSLGFFLLIAYYLRQLYEKSETKALAVGIGSALIIFYSIVTIHQNGYWKDPLTFYEQTLHYTHGSARVYNNLGAAYKELGRNEEALALYTKAIETNPNNIDAYNNLGALYVSDGKVNEAIALYKKALAINPESANVYNNLGNAYRTIGSNEDAIAAYAKAVELNPQYAGAYNNLGNAYRALGKDDEAQSSYKKAIEIDPRYTGAYRNLGILYVSLGKNEEAIALYKKAIEIDPMYAEGYSGLGMAYSAIGEDQQAITAFMKAIEINPNYGEAHNNLAVAYYYAKNYDLAIKHCDKALELGYKVNPEFLTVLEPYRRR